MYKKFIKLKKVIIFIYFNNQANLNFFIKLLDFLNNFLNRIAILLRFYSKYHFPL